jgi:single-stranded-DNA-specific exonuclease
MYTHWQIMPTAPEDFFLQFSDIHRTLSQLLWNRGLRTLPEVKNFLHPNWAEDIYNPFLFSQMSQAVERVFLSLQIGEKITIHGDYDADGVSGTALLFTTLRDLCRFASKNKKEIYDEKKLSFFLPQREKEGYGFSLSTVDYFHTQEKTKLVITVDCGIANHEAISQAKIYGIDTIVCDHHTIPEQIPKEAILIHPLLEDESYPNKFLCGCAVAFKFACALLDEAKNRGIHIPEGYEKWLLDLVAIATVADMVPLLGENRLLEKYGLIVLKKTRRLGLQKLLEMAGTKLSQINTWTIGFQIGPRLNAPGRIDHANSALHLLIEEEEAKAQALAEKLNDLNSKRKDLSQKMYEQAKEQLKEKTEEKLLIVVGLDWKPGLVGLVAGKLVNEFSLPAIAAARQGDHYICSGRSIEELNITEGLFKAAPYLDKFGGHPQACGFSTTGETRFLHAMEILSDFVKEQLKTYDACAKISIEGELPFQEIDLNFWKNLELFEPFGVKNVQPLFLARNVQILSLRLVGNTHAHVHFSVVQQGGIIWKMIGFNFAKDISSLHSGSFIDLVYEINMNEWKGKKELQLRMVDWKEIEKEHF